MTTTETRVLSRNLYIFLFSLLGLVYVAGLFVPLMDNDAAHHANIALRMYLTGDYVNLVDNGVDYLDKPHLHFWLAAASFKIFGVTGFAYKLPSLLFTSGGIYSVYRLGKSLYSAETGRLAALIIASSLSFMLANSDVRMDAILTAAIAFAAWQLTGLLLTKKWIHVLGAALGLALAFSTKGAIGVLVPGLFAIFYAIYLHRTRDLLSVKWLSLLFLFILFISPVLYCYYLQFNLHPEKIIRGKDHINGVRFILFSQSFERYTGEMGETLKKDYLFFIHSFLWTFLPWSLIAIMAFYKKLSGLKAKQGEWATAFVFLVLVLLVSFSGFKLPHYLNISFPFAAVFSSGWLLQQHANPLLLKRIYGVQLFVSLFILLVLAVVNFWSFQVNSYLVMTGVILLLSVYIHFIRSTIMSTLAKSISFSVAAIILCFFLLNTSLYPQLLKYQGGNMLAKEIKGKIDARNIYFWGNSNSASFDFYTGTIRKKYTPGEESKKEKIWLAYYPKDTLEIVHAGLNLGNTLRMKDYEISMIDLPFMNPYKRDSLCSTILLSELIR